jgi:GAF domain-containing protein
LHERAEQRLKENKELAEAARQARAQLDALNQQMTRQSWLRYLQSSTESLGLSADFEAETVKQDSALTPSLEEAMRINHLVQTQDGPRQVIAMPLRVRGQVVGAMEFEMDEAHPFTPEDFDLIREVGDRFGLAAENTRLVQESQRMAQREALVNQISAQLQGTNDVRTTLLEAARGLREALNADRVAIRLGMAEANGSAGNRHAPKEENAS